MYLLLTGISATGKTDIGDHLRDHYGFRHLDFEVLETLFAFWRPSGLRETEVRAAMASLDRVVITWGFVPQIQLQAALQLCALGFKWVWFDGHRDAALRTYLGCGRPRACWDRQMASIEALLDPRLPALGAVMVDPYDAGGELRGRDDVAAELLGPSA